MKFYTHKSIKKNQLIINNKIIKNHLNVYLKEKITMDKKYDHGLYEQFFLLKNFLDSKVYSMLGEPGIWLL